jgi:hypothetical protein
MRAKPGSMILAENLALEEQDPINTILISNNDENFAFVTEKVVKLFSARDPAFPLIFALPRPYFADEEEEII